MTAVIFFPEFTAQEWVVVIGFLVTALCSQITRKKSRFVKIVEAVALVVGTWFSLANAPVIFAVALLLLSIGLIIRLKFKTDEVRVDEPVAPAKGTVG